MAMSRYRANSGVLGLPAPSEIWAPIASLARRSCERRRGCNGWYTSDVNVTWSVVDAQSAISSKVGCGPTTINADTAGSTVSCVATSDGGTTTESVTVKIDKTKPTVAVTGVTAGGQYVMGAVPAAGCQTLDAMSGLATAATVVVTTTGTNGVGAFTASCSGAVDVAGNAQAALVQATYTVVYGFGGFISPLPRSTLTRSGSTIPTKFRLTNASGQPIASSLAAAMAAAGNVKATLSGPGITAVSAVCTWSATDLFFQCNLKTPGGIVSGPAYQITAYERFGTAFVVVPAVGSAVNPEIVFFK